jgi:hypothetical protein
MTLKEYFEQLQEFINENPDALELEVITSVDDEGNGFNQVNYGPSKGNYDGDSFTSEDMFDDWGIGEDGINAVCLN